MKILVIISGSITSCRLDLFCKGFSKTFFILSFSFMCYLEIDRDQGINPREIRNLFICHLQLLCFVVGEEIEIVRIMFYLCFYYRILCTQNWFLEMIGCFIFFFKEKAWEYFFFNSIVTLFHQKDFDMCERQNITQANFILF